MLFSKQIMVLLRTPSDVLSDAVTYLNIYFLGLPFLFMYNVLSSMFNALGRSRIPLYLLIFSSVLNVALDIYMVTVLWTMGVAGCSLGHPDRPGDFRGAVLCHFPAGPEELSRASWSACLTARELQQHGPGGAAVHFAAVHCVHRHDAGPVRGEQLWLPDAGGVLGGDAD